MVTTGPQMKSLETAGLQLTPVDPSRPHWKPLDPSGLVAAGTLVDDEDDGLGAQGVVQRHHHHGVGVAGELADDPLQEDVSQ